MLSIVYYVVFNSSSLMLNGLILSRIISQINLREGPISHLILIIIVIFKSASVLLESGSWPNQSSYSWCLWMSYHSIRLIQSYFSFESLKALCIFPRRWHWSLRHLCIRHKVSFFNSILLLIMFLIFLGFYLFISQILLITRILLFKLNLSFSTQILFIILLLCRLFFIIMSLFINHLKFFKN
jgi:hypothetical protein